MAQKFPDEQRSPADWPASLRAVLDLVRDWPEPMAIVWHEPPVQRCNEAYALLLDHGGGGPGSFLIEQTDVDAVMAAGRAFEARARRFPGHPNPHVRARSFGFVAAPLRDDSGAVRGVLQRLWEVAPAPLTADARVLNDLQHRLRNVLASIRALVRRTEAASDSLPEFVDHLDGRLRAMARTQSMLLRGQGLGVDLEHLLREELLAQAADDGRIATDGPPIRLTARRAEVMALVLHELATNATKFGALRHADGRLAVSWRLGAGTNGPWLRLEWRESGVPVAGDAPRHRGFGTELITQRIAYELGGEGVLDFRPGGAHAAIAFPTEDVADAP